MRHLVILIGGHLSTAPRPQKEAAAAVQAGMRVSIRGTWWSEKLAIEDEEISRSLGVDFKPVVDMRPGRPGRLPERLRQKFARLLFEKFRIVSPSLFGRGAQKLLAAARSLHGDLTMVHSEAGLWAAERLLKEGYRVGVDFEDWFSQDMPEEDRKGRPVSEIQRLERMLLCSTNLTITTTRAMAEAMRQDAGADITPLVVYNAFPAKSAPPSVRPGQVTGKPVRFFWFSQTIGHARGLECLAEALMRLTGDWELHLLGRMSSNEWFDSTFPSQLRSRIIVHAPVTNAELPHLTAQFEVGLALEIPYAASRDRTATNKIFEYLRCGMAIVATKTKGQEEVMLDCPDAGWLVPPNAPIDLANCLQHCIDQPDAVLAAQQASAQAGSNQWSWEQHRPILMNALTSAAEA